jgi:hypothetical protein
MKSRTETQFLSEIKGMKEKMPDEEIIREAYWDIDSIKVDWIKRAFQLSTTQLIEIAGPREVKMPCIHCQKNELLFTVRNRSEFYPLRNHPESALRDPNPPYVSKDQFQYSCPSCIEKVQELKDRLQENSEGNSRGMSFARQEKPRKVNKQAQYRLFYGTPEELENKVNEKLACPGWKVWGPPLSGAGYISQAMIQEESFFEYAGRLYPDVSPFTELFADYWQYDPDDFDARLEATVTALLKGKESH